MRFFDLTQKDQQANDNLTYEHENILPPQNEGGVFIFPLPSEDA